MSRNYLSKNDELRRGDYLMSNNREFKAWFQDDGNFVIYGWKPIWSADTQSSDAHRLCMQADCNFVMYKKNAEAMWHTNSAKSNCNMCRIYLKDDGTLVLYREAEEIWSSASSKGVLCVYKKNAEAMWHTNSAKSNCNMCHIYLKDDGTLVLYREAEEIWSSASSKGKK